MSGANRVERDARRDFSRRFVALVLALFALGWLAERAHVALETHTYCAEHQRIEHGSDRVHAEDGHDHSVPGPVFEALELDADSHAACCTLLARGDDPIALPPMAACALRAPPLPGASHSAAWSTNPRGTLETVRFAPKHSPPAV